MSFAFCSAGNINPCEKKKTHRATNLNKSKPDLQCVPTGCCTCCIILFLCTCIYIVAELVQVYFYRR